MYIVFDIGGTHMRVARSRNGHTLDGAASTISTPKNFDRGVAEFAKLANVFLGNEKCIAAAGSIAGPFNKDRTMLLRAPHLPDWMGKPIMAKFKSTQMI